MKYLLMVLSLFLVGGCADRSLNGAQILAVSKFCLDQGMAPRHTTSIIDDIVSVACVRVIEE